MNDRDEVHTTLSRRAVLRCAGVVGLGLAAAPWLGAAAAAAATKTTKRTTKTATTKTATTKTATRTAATKPAAAMTAKNAVATPTCVLSPDSTEGPYYLALDQVRADITEGRPGTPLELALRVMDVTGCKPAKGAVVDIWHCDAAGAYSGVSGDSAVFLRGTQISDASGDVRFTTIYPGAYPGRTVHIHVKVHVGGKDPYTGQLYFDDVVTDVVYKAAPYNRTTRRSRNSDDDIFRQAGAASTLALSPEQRGGYVGAVTLGVKP